MKKCQSCQARNDDGALQCSLCGVRFAASSPATARAGAGTVRGPAGRGSAPEAAAILEPRLWQAGKPRTMRETMRRAKTRHFLVPPFGEPVPIVASKTGAKIMLGRDDDCDVKIATPTVSRHHAEIEIKGEPPRAHLHDLGTKNGTRVNGKKLKADVELADRDVVRLGDATAVYRVLGPEEDEKALVASNNSTMQMNETLASISTATESLHGLNGDISFMPMTELLVRLARLKASGTLHVEVDGVKGEAHLAAGATVDAKFAGLEGPSAVQAFSDLRRGKFKFEAKKGG